MSVMSSSEKSKSQALEQKLILLCNLSQHITATKSLISLEEHEAMQLIASLPYEALEELRRRLFQAGIRKTELPKALKQALYSTADEHAKLAVSTQEYLRQRFMA
jgi:hypothetical protein